MSVTDGMKTIAAALTVLDLDLHLSLDCQGHWGTIDNFKSSFLHSSLFSTAPWDLANSRPVHSLMVSSHLFLRLPCLLPLFTAPCKLVLARPDERETCPYMYFDVYLMPNIIQAIACDSLSNPRSLDLVLSSPNYY